LELELVLVWASALEPELEPGRVWESGLEWVLGSGWASVSGSALEWESGSGSGLRCRSAIRMSVRWP